MSRSPAFATSNKPRSPSVSLSSWCWPGSRPWACPLPSGRSASIGGIGGRGSGRRHSRSRSKSPVAPQVFQRDANGRATIPLELDDSVKDAKVVDAAVMAFGQDASAFINSQAGERARFVDGKLVGVPTGGPYTIA